MFDKGYKDGFDGILPQEPEDREYMKGYWKGWEDGE